MTSTPFETKLKDKLSQRTTGRITSETVLSRAFKYFDLDNSGSVSFSEWTRAIEKIGVGVADPAELRRVFDAYDTDGSGSLDYKEFGARIFRQDAVPPTEQRSTDFLIPDLRSKLGGRGVRGLLGLARQFKMLDSNSSKLVDHDDFASTLRSYRLGLSEEAIEQLYSEFSDTSGYANYDAFIKTLRGALPPSRRVVIEQAYDQLVAQSRGGVKLQTLASSFNCREHPDVTSANKTEEEAYNDFLDTFEVCYELSAPRSDGQVTKQHFDEYCAYVSASYPSDDAFITLMTKVWSLRRAAPQAAATSATVRPRTPINSRNSAAKPDVQTVLSYLRSKLAQRGIRGIIGLQKQFKNADRGNIRQLTIGEFKKACRDFKLELGDQDIDAIFEYVDSDRSGKLTYDELIKSLRTPMKQQRTDLVGKAWKRLNPRGAEAISIEDIKGAYSPKQHPAVKTGQKMEDEVLGEFLETFEAHHWISEASRKDRLVTWEEFYEYYWSVSTAVPDDAFFEALMKAAWRIRGDSPERSGTSWAKVGTRTTAEINGRPGMPVHSNAPFGTSAEPSDWSTALRPKATSDDMLSISKEIPCAGISTTLSEAHKTRPVSRAGYPLETLLGNLRARLKNRGIRGFIGLKKLFASIDLDGSGNIEFDEFSRALRNFRITSNETEASQLFAYFESSPGKISYMQFIDKIRGPLNEQRKALILAAFNTLDVSGDGQVKLEDIRRNFDATNHPEVRMGKRTQDEVLFEFLETFQQHHDVTNPGLIVDLREFLAYYSNMSAAVDDDRYFELMLRNTWNFENKYYEKVWQMEFPTQTKRLR
jgi:Ca2+-binding EF-hand superfamily protein